MNQVDARPNVIQVILDAAARTRPPMLLPPQVVKYNAKMFSAWHAGIEILRTCVDFLDSSNSNSMIKDPVKIKDSALNAIAELYSLLSEDDYFFGLWRRRCMYPETNAALSFEQCEMWQKAQNLYEAAQMKARNGRLPFNDSEYSVWEDRWYFLEILFNFV